MFVFYYYYYYTDAMRSHSVYAIRGESVMSELAMMEVVHALTV